MWVGLSSITNVLITERQKENTHPDRKPAAAVEAEMEGMQPQAKGSREPPEAGRDKEGFFPRACRGSTVLLTSRS